MYGNPDVTGAVIDEGPDDWQILQQGPDGSAEIPLAGRWGVANEPAAVEVRVVYEDSGVPVAGHLDWTAAETAADGTWRLRLPGVPAGGLYRVETHVRMPGAPREWSPRGDMRHFVGVGDLWVIAGQSNSAGYGRGPCEDPPQLGVHLLDNALRWTLARQPLNESTDTAHAVNRENANPGHSPWLAFAKGVLAATGVPIGLVQTSLGGSPLTHWDPTDGGPSPLFENMFECVRVAGGTVRGVLWYQGESDAGPEASGTYQKRFASAVKAWRDALGRADLHVLTVQLNRHLAPQEDPADRGWSVVREAQRRCARELEDVSIVPAIDLPLSDFIHNSPAGNVLLGERAARAALAAVYGLDVPGKAPDIESAEPEDAGRALRLRFANVVGRIDTIDAESRPFVVADEAGAVPVEGVEYPGDETVVVRLGRDLRGRAVVSGLYGRSPAGAPPRDMARQMPILAFCDVEVGS